MASIVPNTFHLSADGHAQGHNPTASTTPLPLLYSGENSHYVCEGWNLRRVS
jgi:hypothetical protein